VYWFATANVPPGGRDGRVQTELLKRFGGWHDPIRRLIEATPPQLIVRTDITDRPPVDRWSKGRVVLLGDAAHPMTPNLGQGGCQAIEDAVVLAEELQRASGVTEAVQAYERRRVARANATVRASWSMGRLAQWENLVACAFRTLLMRATPPGIVERQLVAALRPVVGAALAKA
jgi:2-polyprenyl-6-methoxyphenol hydroxylase-like FAD-dependent oxidoreductase